MLKNLLLIALRNITKQSSYSLINIVGLTIGITCSIFLLLYILDELSFDKYHKNADKIYRVVSHIQEPDKSFSWGVTQAPAGPALKEEYPAVENYVRFFPMNRVLLKLGEKQFYEEDVYAADSTVFDIFSYNILEGDPQTALDAPFSLVLTKDLAIKYFGNESAVGKIIQDENDESYKITAVLENVPKNSHFTFNALTSVTQEMRQNQNWGGFYVTTYVMVPDLQKVNSLKAILPEMYSKYMENIFGRMGIAIQYDLQPLPSIHLHSKMEGESGGDMAYIYTFSAVAIFMLLIASINYMNLATARSSSRAKEVGMRKVLGSNKIQLVSQFLSESIILTVISLILSMVTIAVLLPFFNYVSGKEIPFSYLFQTEIVIALIGIIVFIGILGGGYPALVLSNFKPVLVLKGKLTTGSSNALFRKILVVLQFSISLVMVICTWIVFDQLNFMQNKDLGYDKAHVLTVGFPDGGGRQFPTIRNTLLSNPKILNVATASSRTSNISSRNIFNVETENGMQEKGFKPLGIDHNYVSTMGMKITQGRDFSVDIPADTLNGVLINEETARKMNWEEPLGKKVQIGRPNEGEEPNYAEVIGVLRDFHQQSLYSKIEPLIILYRPNNRILHVKIQGEEIPSSLAFIEEEWKKTFSGTPFEYNFLDQDFQSAYEADQIRGQIFTVFSALTIFIACLGLLGLVSFTTQQRTKEIGIRKVIGAGISQIVFLISMDFILLVIIATLISFPIAYYFMNDWLNIFAYKTELKVATFLFSALLVFLITILTVGIKTFQAAIVNPVRSLRSE
ncbi:ABC transporter permease [Flexithrix dorotheae]|uniref:ABC transporter permease n=1 Tax=Flexithrix dorotheae TaxID=70993 RepID=UPI0003604F3F|nr:ABC transporter permease [Flexithrix dorotheae]